MPPKGWKAPQSRERLVRIAELYDEAIDTEQKSIYRFIGGEMGLTKDVVAHLVMDARKAGLLPPTFGKRALGNVGEKSPRCPMCGATRSAR